MKKTRRHFTDEFKRKVLTEVAAAGQASKVLDKYRLSWTMYNRFKNVVIEPPKASKANGAHKPKPIALEAIIYLKHARKAWDSGHGKRGELLARLALDVLEEK